MTADINFHLIRPHRGARDGGFEELCAQVARLDDKAKGLAMVRTGAGGDAGVECYVTRANGKQTGWQSKYLFAWDATLEAQLNKSIAAVWTKRPDLDEYIVCLPFALPAGVKDGQESARQKYDAWREKKVAEAGKPFDIILWDESELVGKLTKPGAPHAGRIAYFFDNHVLDAAKLRQRFEHARKQLGSRYTPETNIALPIRQTFLGLARAPEIELALRTHVEAIAAAARKTAAAPADADLDVLRKTLIGAVETTLAAIAGHDFKTGALPLSSWLDLHDAAMAAATPVLHAIAQTKRGEGRELQGAFDDLSALLGNLGDFLHSDVLAAWNAKACLLDGEAGAGKSHLLADVVHHELEAGGPSILVLGAWFKDDEPWAQVMVYAGFPSTYSVDEFLASLDAAAEAAGRRALICVDALNERHGIDVWPHRLAAFLSEAAAYQHICVVISCRSIFLPGLGHALNGAGGLIEIEHVGFARTGGRAARDYLAVRGKTIDTGPGALPEFDNPLFLRTLCDLLDKRGETSLPKGLAGFPAIVDAYLDAISLKITADLKLTPAKRVPQRVLDALIDCMIEAEESELDYDVAAAAVEDIHPSGNAEQQDILHALASEGALVIEPYVGESGGAQQLVRFTFERFSDHSIARRLLARAGTADFVAGFATGGELHAYISDWRHAGVASAMAMQLPERYGAEMPEFAEGELVRRAFKASLSSRAPAAFTTRTVALMEEQLEPAERTRVFIGIATDADNAFNARHLFERLAPLSMPERDAVWSTDLIEIGLDGEIEALIEWAFADGLGEIEAERAELAGIALTLMLTTSHRGVRDRATTALATLLTPRLDLARALFKQFETFDDLYLRERLLAAIYGAALQGFPDQPVGALAKSIYAAMFADGRPPPNAMLRDYAAGIVEYADWRGALDGTLNLSTVRPPFESDWTAEQILESGLDEYVETYGQGNTIRDSIVRSVTDDDFGRYIIAHVIDDWSVSPLGSEPVKRRARFDAWYVRFEVEAGAEQIAAFIALAKAVQGAADTSEWEDTPPRHALKAARADFRAALGESEWETYRQEAQNYIEHFLFSDHPGTDTVVTTDLLWAYRWVAKRAHDLGWTADRFGAFDRNIRSGGSRHEHHVERIGKKYQWLALYELMAHLSDTRVFTGRRFHDEALERFRGPDQLIGIRNIDPSLLVRETHYDGWRQWPATWWSPVDPKLRPLSPLERLAWRDSEADILNDASLIEVIEPSSGETYLCLHGFAHWRQAAGRDGLDHETWYRIYCLVTRKEDAPRLITQLKDKRLTADEPASEFDMGYCFLGENPWFAPLAAAPDWVRIWRHGGVDVDVRAPVAQYLREKNAGYDHSIDANVGVALPAPWLIEALGLHLTSGRTLTYENGAGKRIFFDPSVSAPGPQAALVSKQAFLDLLDREGLAAVWVVSGEKGVFGGRATEGFGGRLLHSTLYWREGAGFASHAWRGHELPSTEQLKRLLGAEALPAGVDMDAVIQRYGPTDDEDDVADDDDLLLGDDGEDGEDV